MVTKKLDIQSILQEELSEQRKKKIKSFQRAPENVDFRISLDEETVPPRDLGAQQVESLLSFKIDPEIERALEDAKLNNLIYDALGEHPIFGTHHNKRKKQK